ncbi:MAG: hypothetical protein M1827_006862 [Pycnora praestabilis]|nr:MAG: hypothetical protein M1827_006862 [Pycnora praestabilis]
MADTSKALVTQVEDLKRAEALRKEKELDLMGFHFMNIDRLPGATYPPEGYVADGEEDSHAENIPLPSSPVLKKVFPHSSLARDRQRNLMKIPMSPAQCEGKGFVAGPSSCDGDKIFGTHYKRLDEVPSFLDDDFASGYYSDIEDESAFETESAPSEEDLEEEKIASKVFEQKAAMLRTITCKDSDPPEVWKRELAKVIAIDEQAQHDLEERRLARAEAKTPATETTGAKRSGSSASKPAHHNAFDPRHKELDETPSFLVEDFSKHSSEVEDGSQSFLDTTAEGTVIPVPPGRSPPHLTVPLIVDLLDHRPATTNQDAGAPIAPLVPEGEVTTIRTGPAPDLSPEARNPEEYGAAVLESVKESIPVYEAFIKTQIPQRRVERQAELAARQATKLSPPPHAFQEFISSLCLEEFLATPQEVFATVLKGEAPRGNEGEAGSSATATNINTVVDEAAPAPSTAQEVIHTSTHVDACEYCNGCGQRHLYVPEK